MAKQPTPQGISALLKEAGFTRSDVGGYRVNPYREGGVVVTDRPGFARGVAAQVREHEKLNAYTEAIEAAGFKVQQDQVGFSTSLIVSAQDAKEAQ